MPKTCKNGHRLRPGSFRMEGNSIRCKACAREQKKEKYASDPAYRRRALAYAHWFKVGDAQGRSWPDVKKELGI